MKKIVEFVVILLFVVFSENIMSQTDWVDFDNLSEGGPEPKVEISIFTNSGQLIRIFYLGSKLKGTYSIEFDGNDLPNGVYFYSLKINSIVSCTKKMTIIK